MIRFFLSALFLIAVTAATADAEAPNDRFSQLAEAVKEDRPAQVREHVVAAIDAALATGPGPDERDEALLDAVDRIEAVLGTRERGWPGHAALVSLAGKVEPPLSLVRGSPHPVIDAMATGATAAGKLADPGIDDATVMEVLDELWRDCRNLIERADGWPVEVRSAAYWHAYLGAIGSVPPTSSRRRQFDRRPDLLVHYRRLANRIRKTGIYPPTVVDTMLLHLAVPEAGPMHAEAIRFVHDRLTQGVDAGRKRVLRGHRQALSRASRGPHPPLPPPSPEEAASASAAAPASEPTATAAPPATKVEPPEKTAAPEAPVKAAPAESAVPAEEREAAARLLEIGDRLREAGAPEAAARRYRIIVARYPHTSAATAAARHLERFEASRPAEDEPTAAEQREAGEATAARHVRMARLYREALKDRLAVKELKRVLESYPETKAATTARELLEEWGAR